MKTLILGMGNPILSDDRIGLLIAQMLQCRVEGADIAYSAVVGMNLLDAIVGYDSLVVIDAMTTPEGKAGSLKKLSDNDGYGSRHLFSSHGMNIFDLLEFGRCSGFQVPRLEAAYGIEIGSEVAFGEELTPGLQEKVPEIIEVILADMRATLSSLSGEPRT